MKNILRFSFFCLQFFVGTSSYAQNWIWAKSAGGIFADGGYSVSADANGNVFVTGYFQSPTITFGSTTLTNAGIYNVFIAKYDANGNVLWAKSAGGTFEDVGYSVSADAGGNVFVTGYFKSPTLTFGSTTLTNAGGGFSDIFIAKYDSNGNILWAKSAGGNGSGAGTDVGYSVSADAGGNVFVTGGFASPTLTFGSTTLTNANAGVYNIFIAKYDANGKVLWAKSAGGIYTEEGYSVSADAGGNVFVTGWFQSPTITFGSITLTNSGSSVYTNDIFIAKYDANGKVLWAKSAGGTNDDYGYSVSADAGGNVFVTGSFTSPTLTFGSTTLTSAGSRDVFIAKYDATGKALWAKSVGGTGSEEGYSVSADAGGNVFVTGGFQSPTIIFGSITLTNSGSSVYTNDIFIAKYDANGNVLCASSLASRSGGSGGVSVDPSGSAYIVGEFHTNPFIVGTDTLLPVAPNAENIFVAKYRCGSILNVSVTHTDPLCNSQCTGTGTANPANGVSPCTYNWSNSQTTQTATGLCAGTYSVLVTDAFSGTSTATITITQPIVLSATVSAASATCLNNNGSASVIAGGGTPGYSYNWNPSAQTTQTATGLTAGNYSVIITDTNGCTKTQTVTVTATNPLTVSTSSTHTGCAINNATAIPNNGTAPYTYTWNPSGQTTQTATGLAPGSYSVTVKDFMGCSFSNTISISSPPLLTHSFPAVTNVNCFGKNTGSASVNVNGGTPGYSYQWNPSAQTTQTATGLSAGTYTVTITDSLGCTFTDSIVIASPLPLSHSINVTNVDCFGNNNGSAIINVLGGTPSYTYSWSSSPIQTTQTITGLYAGVYSVTVTDSHGCSSSDTVVIKSPTGLTAFSPVVSNVLCFGGNTGSATVTATGGTPGYNYSWNPTAQTTSAATGLTAGVYTITITDNNGCTVKTLVPIAQPPLLTSASSQTNILCFGGSTGTATVIPAGGTAPYSYLWNPASATTSAVTGLSSGTYSILITDANGCTFDTTVTLTQPLAALSSFLSSVNVLCNPDSTGLAGAIVSGGTPGYTYWWMPGGQTTQSISNLAAGTYSVTFTDANGCSAASSIIITQPPLLTTAISSNTSICSGTSVAANTITIGGTPGYTYLWMPSGATTSGVTFSPTVTTSYTAQVTDANGCSAPPLVTTVTVIPTPAALFESSLDKCSRCVQLTDQSIYANAWLWNFGDGTTSALQNPAHCFSAEGVYTISLTVNSSPQCKNTFSLPDSVFGYELAPIIPNVFTPNGDGVNDVFSITGLDKCSPYSLKIYDRWGALIFETEKTGFVWDGRTSAGVPAQQGTYYFVLSNSTTIKTGFVTLLR